MAKTEKMLTARQVAQRLGVGHRTVLLWAKQGKIKGAVLIETVVGPHWEIPERAMADMIVRGRGRPPKPKLDKVGHNRRKKATS